MKNSISHYSGGARVAMRRCAIKNLKLHGIYYINSKSLSGVRSRDIFVEFKKYFSCEIDEHFYNFEAMTTENADDYVYVIGNTSHNICKIGYSKYPLKRLSEIQTGCPYYLKIILIVKGSMKTERSLHKKYNKYRLSGEWFSFVGHLKESIESISKTEVNIAKKMLS